MKILVTGGSGFIGTNYIDMLEKLESKHILNIDKKAPMNKTHQKYWKNCNILDRDKMQDIINQYQPTHVVHLAAKTGVYEKSVEEFIDNTKGTQILIKILKGIKSIERVIFTSSLLVCKMGYVPKNDTDYNPSTPYGQSKVNMEKIIRVEKDMHFSWIIIRPISVWGPWFNEPYINFFKSIAHGWYFHIGKGHYKRSLGYVGNIAHQIQSILVAEESIVDKKTFYVADEEALDLYEMASEIQKQLSAPKVRHLPLILAQATAIVGDLFLFFGYKSFPITSFRLNNIRTEYVWDVSPIINLSGKQPFDYKLGISNTINWLKENKQIN